MALTGMIRKASPSVFPLALRAIGFRSSTTVNGTISAFRQRQSHSFSNAATAKDLVDERLYKDLEHELKSAKSNLKSSMVNTLPDSFPFTVEDEDFPRRRLTLKREFPDEDEYVTITIENIQELKSYHKTSLDDDTSKDNKSSPEDDNESDSNSESDEEISVEGIKAPAIPMSVSVTKAGGDKSLDFEITVSEDDILIKSIEINNDEKDYCVGSLEGPKFEELDHGLQQSLYKYLEIRGIKRDIASVLLKCIAMENKKLDVMALKHFKKVIKK